MNNCQKHVGNVPGIIWCICFKHSIHLVQPVCQDFPSWQDQKKTQECPVVLWKNIFYAENNLLVYLTADTFTSVHVCLAPVVESELY